MMRAVDDVLAEIGVGGDAASARAQQGRSARRRAPPRAVLPPSRGPPRLRRHRRGARGARRGDRGRVRALAAGRRPARAVLRGSRRSRSSTTSPATSSARTPPRASASPPACPPSWPSATTATRATATARASPGPTIGTPGSRLNELHRELRVHAGEAGQLGELAHVERLVLGRSPGPRRGSGSRESLGRRRHSTTSSSSTTAASKLSTVVRSLSARSTCTTTSKPRPTRSGSMLAW